MKTRNNLASIVLGAAIMSTSAFAGMNGSCGAGKCGADMKKNSGKCTTEKCEEMKGKKNGSCGAGKCGSDMKKKATGSCGADMKAKKSSGSCGAGKCGASMKPKKSSGSCGAGKCGSI